MNHLQQIHYWAHMLDEAFSKDALLTEGKHWPEDYAKTAFNIIKQSPVGQQSWYSDNYISQDVKTFVDEFAPLSHKSSNLGFFMAIIRWFIEYSNGDMKKYKEFIERKLDGIIVGLLKIRNDKSYDAMADKIKKMNYEQFMKFVDEVNAKSSVGDVNVQFTAKYKVVPIYSYEELHEKYGGDKTGWHGQSEWCHTNGVSTYESWTKEGTQMFFVVEREDWKDVKAPTEKPNNCYDEYGMSLIAILIDVKTNKLLNSTSRWNHVVLPASGAADTMFESWDQLNKAVGIDVEKFCREECQKLNDKIIEMQKNANVEAQKKMEGEFFISQALLPLDLKYKITEIIVPNSAKAVENFAFEDCNSLTSITFPNSVKSIGSNSVSNCPKLEIVNLPNEMEYIGPLAFFYCSGLKKVHLPKDLQSIEEKTFAHCEKLEEVEIGSKVQEIKRYAFSQCKSLKKINLPEKITEISDWTFKDCKNLKSIELPKGLKKIGIAAFFNANLESLVIPSQIQDIGFNAFYNCRFPSGLIFKGKTLEDVKSMANYPWGIDVDQPESIIKCEDNMLSENKNAYLKKHADEDDVQTVVEMFWHIRNRLSAPQNDIDWWIKKPFNDLKSFVQNFDKSNKRQRRDANYKQQAIDNGAKLLDTKDGYEIWYVPTYDAMLAIGRFYKGRSAKWCVASDDPDFWFDNHEDSEFVVLVREHPQNDKFDKVAIEMMNHGRYYNEDDIIPWDLENEDWTFTDDNLIHEAWFLFKDNGETREQYFG